MSIENALRAVKKETGYSLSADELQGLMDMYKSMTSSAIQHRISHYQKGEHGGDTVEKTAVIDDLRIVLAARQALGKTTMSGATMGNMAKQEPRTIEVPQWLVDQFEIDGNDAESGEIPKGLKYDQVERFDVGTFETNTLGPVRVELEAASGQSNWWNTINVFDARGRLLEQSDANFDLLGDQEYDMSDGTVIYFQVESEEPRPREWSPRKKKPKMSGPVMGLDTADERQHARAMAAEMLAKGREGGPVARAEARGYMKAIRDLAVDEGAPELARQMEGFLEELK